MGGAAWGWVTGFGSAPRENFLVLRQPGQQRQWNLATFALGIFSASFSLSLNCMLAHLLLPVQPSCVGVAHLHDASPPIDSPTARSNIELSAVSQERKYFRHCNSPIRNHRNVTVLPRRPGKIPRLSPTGHPRLNKNVTHRNTGQATTDRPTTAISLLDSHVACGHGEFSISYPLLQLLDDHLPANSASKTRFEVVATILGLRCFKRHRIRC